LLLVEAQSSKAHGIEVKVTVFNPLTTTDAAELEVESGETIKR
jgi:hypothetical protein